MTTVNIRRYSDPDALKEIAPGHLLALMEGFIDKVDARGGSKTALRWSA